MYVCVCYFIYTKDFNQKRSMFYEHFKIVSFRHQCKDPPPTLSVMTKNLLKLISTINLLSQICYYSFIHTQYFNLFINVNTDVN